MQERRYTKPPRVRNLIAFSSLIMLLFCIIVGVQATRSYQLAIEEGKVNADRLTRIVADHTELAFHGVDLSLKRAVERQYFNTLFGGNLPSYMEHNFRLWVDETPNIAAMMLVDEKGNVQVAAHKKGYENWFNYGRSLAGEPVFEQMRDANDRQFFIGPYSGHTDEGRDLIILSRKLNKLDGSFGGIVVAAVDPVYFVDFFSSVEMGAKRFMSLRLTDGTPLVSGPENAGMAAALVDEGIAEFPKEEPYAVVTDTKSIHDSIKILSHKRIPQLPVVVSVALDEEDFLSGWRSARIKDIGFLAIFTVFGSVLSFFALTMARQIVYVEESEAAAVLASQAKSEFLANMSHELRTPLNAIIGFSEMMSSGYFGALNPKQKERIHDINLCGNHLLQLISDILEFSKGDAGKLELVEENVDIAEVIKEVLRIMNDKIKGKSINLIVDVPPGLPLLWADKRKIRQMLLNLLSNAIKFTPEDGNIKVSAKLDQQKNMNLIVADTGIGIAEEDIPTALSVFGQVHRSQSHEGTGLGLPLCKMFAELHGGKMALVSAVGEGTTVRVTFPASRLVMGGEAKAAEGKVPLAVTKG